MAFKYRKSLVTKDAPTHLSYVIANSETITVGDAVDLDTSGYVTAADAGDEVLGIVVGVVDSDGLPVDPDSGTTSDYTVEADNESDKAWEAQVIVDKMALFYNDADDDLATTNLLQFFDLTSESQIDQSSASDTSGQFQLISLDPDGDGDDSKGLFKIAESQLDAYAQQ